MKTVFDAVAYAVLVILTIVAIVLGHVDHHLLDAPAGSFGAHHHLLPRFWRFLVVFVPLATVLGCAGLVGAGFPRTAWAGLALIVLMAAWQVIPSLVARSGGPHEELAMVAEITKPEVGRAGTHPDRLVLRRPGRGDQSISVGIAPPSVGVGSCVKLSGVRNVAGFHVARVEPASGCAGL